VIIDFHTHLFPEDIIARRESFFDDRAFALLYSHPRSKMISHGTLLADMDSCGVDISVAMGFPWEDPDRCAGHNRYLSTLRSVSGGRIIAFGALPMLDFARVEEHAALIRDLGLSGIGEIALYNGCDPARCENYLRAVMEAAARYCLPYACTSMSLSGTGIPANTIWK
jgi:hypothetical protein